MRKRPALLLVCALSPTLLVVWHALAAPRPRPSVLDAIPNDPAALVNIGAADMPASPDVLVLGRRSTRALERCLADNPSAGLRAECAEMLGTLGDPAALGTLHTALEDWEAHVRLRVIQALGRIADARSTAALLAAWNRSDEGAENRAAILRALGAMGDKQAIAFLRKTLRDPKQDAPQIAFAALWRCRHLLSRAVLVGEVAFAIGDARRALAYAATLKAAELKAPALVRPLLARIDDSDDDLRNKAIRALGLIGDRRAVPPLLRLLTRARDARLLNNVAFALERTDRKGFFTEVGRLIRHKQAVIRMNAAFVVGDVHRQEGAALLAGALRDPSDRVRLEAMEAAAKLPDPSPLLAIALEDRDVGVRLTAVRAVRSARTPRPLLERALRDDEPSVRAAAIEAASATTPPQPDLVQKGLSDRDLAVRAEAIRAVRELKLAGARPALEAFLGDEHAPLYEEAIAAIHDLSPSGAADLIYERLFRSDDPGRKRRAAVALGRLGDARVRDYLVACLLDKSCSVADGEPLYLRETDPSVIRRLQLQWARQRPELGGLLAALHPPGTLQLALADVELRGPGDRDLPRLVEVLVQLGDAAARPAVERSLAGADPWLRTRLLLQLGRLGDPTAPLRAAALLDDLPVDWLPRAASLLAQASEPGQRSALLPQLRARERDADFHVALAAAAAHLDWQAGVLPPRLVDGLVSPRPRERELARRYLRGAPEAVLRRTATTELRRGAREELEQLHGT
jgi:HEAT repeat protein